MSLAQQQLVVAPIVLPLATGALLLLFNERRHLLKAVVSIASVLALIGVSIALLLRVDASPVPAYAVGNWLAPFGIVLVADRLSAVLVLLASILALASLLFSLARWHRAGPRFHALVHFLAMGLNGAFLTGDLFNLFVFFELLLAASYGLALHGSGTLRVRASLHYITINVTASLLFLIGASMIYAVTGTLNMADLAARIPLVAPGDRVLLEAGAGILGVAFLIKAGIWPLCFWLPGTYAAASAPAAALFAILSKVGIYAILRLWLLFFGAGSGASAGFGEVWLLAGGVMTLVFGLIGVLASQELSRIAGFSLLESSALLLFSFGADQAAITAPAIYYLIVSTLGISAFYLLIELVERARAPGADVLAVTAEVFGDIDDDDDTERADEVGFAIPATMAFLGLSFACCGLLLAGLPPMPGFVAKFALLSAFLDTRPITPAAWTMVVLLTSVGVAAIIAVSRIGIRIFWVAGQQAVPRVRVSEMAPVLLLLGLCVGLTLQAGPAMRYLQDAADALHAPHVYIEQVLPAARPR